MRIKIITFNAWDIPFWFSAKRYERAHHLGPYLKNWEPDIVCLQEAFDVEHRRHLKEDLGDHTFNTIAAYDETRRVLLFKRFDLTGGLVVLSKFPIRQSSFTPFHRPLRMTLPERIGRKGFLKVLLETPAGPLWVVNVHLYSGKFKINHRMRLFQLSQLLAEIKDLDPATPMILAGDFNEDNFINKEEFFKQIGAAGFVDGEEILGKAHVPTYRFENPYAETIFHTRHISMRIDYVFIRDESSKLKFTDYEVLPQPQNFVLSDHDPVMAALEY